ncbi:MAG: glycosyltransferase family 39 protein [Desulfobacteraceae bacterium]|nr:glycosyltransferase family 39 protein [Desulfobacteraceae bacterium]
MTAKESSSSGGLLLLWALLTAVALACRPLLPVDETRYVSVAWEMWQRGEFLVPHLNGLPYSHKPPLLFWLIHLGWWIFGVNEWTPRLVGPLAGLADLFLTRAIGRALWPEQPAAGMLAPFLLLGSLLWTVFTTLTLFDTLLTLFVLAALWAMVTPRLRWTTRWLLVGVFIGGGLLAKGPVVFLHVVPAALLFPWWGGSFGRGDIRKWFGGLALACLMGTAIAAFWALPAAAAGGSRYGQAILWEQTAGRVVGSFAHRQPFWFYLALLPPALFPWLLWKRIWSGKGAIWKDTGLRFCLAWMVSSLAALSLVSGKQVHYLLPLIPSMALMGAKILVDRSMVEQPARLWGPAAFFAAAGGVLLSAPVLFAGAGDLPRQLQIDAGWAWVPVAVGLLLVFWRPKRVLSVPPVLAAASIALVCSLHFAVFHSLAPAYDVRPMALRIASIQRSGKAVAQFGTYSGQYQFAGRLEKPLEVLPSTVSLTAWVHEHPDGYILLNKDPDQTLSESGAFFEQDYRRKRAILWNAKIFASIPDVFNRL